MPTTVHCDHLIQAKVGAQIDLGVAIDTNAEVYDFLQSVSAKYGIGFWKPGSGIIHQVVLEQYAFPGGMMIGTDSHTPNAGGLGMVAIGVGGADAVDVMTGYPFNVRFPKVIGVHLTGELSGWTAPKDVILKVAGILTVKGGTGAIVEYFGPGRRLHLGHRQGHHLQHGRRDRRHHLGVRLRRQHGRLPQGHRPRGDRRRRQRRAPTTCDPTPRSYADPADFYDQVIEIDLSDAGPADQRPALPRPGPQGQRGRRRRRGERTGRSRSPPPSSAPAPTRPTRTSPAPRRSPARPRPRGSRRKTKLLITPGLRAGAGHHRARRAARRPRGHRRRGAGQRLRPVHRPVGPARHGPVDQVNTIVNSYNRNFPKRNDGSANTLSFVTSPDTVIALALAGRLDFNPVTDTLTNDAGEEVRLDAPVGEQLPAKGFDPGEDTFIAPPADGSGIEVKVDPTSDRLQLLEPFAPWDGKDYVELPVLLKAQGKCTTDHISMAGPWLKYRGHLENISGNLFVGVINAFTGEAGTGKDPLDGETKTLPRHRQAPPRGGRVAGWPSATRTTARARPASTPPWSPGSAAPR